MKKLVRRILMVICWAVFCYSAYNLVDIYLGYKKIDDTYEDVAQEYTKTVEEDQFSYLEIDWKELQERNADVKAWIQIPDTHVNYPVLQGETNDSYIHSDIDKKELKAGSIFVASENPSPFEDINTVIYGHNMKNGSMFHDIKSYTDQEFADSHPYIYIYLPDGTVSRYRVFAAHIISATSELYNPQVNDLQAFYKKIMETNNISVTYDQNNLQSMITLSTCTSGGSSTNKRNVVHAYLEEKGIQIS